MISYEYSKNRSDDTSELASVAQKKKRNECPFFSLYSTIYDSVIVTLR